MVNKEIVKYIASYFHLNKTKNVKQIITDDKLLLTNDLKIH